MIANISYTSLKRTHDLNTLKREQDKPIKVKQTYDLDVLIEDNKKPRTITSTGSFYLEA